MGRCKALLDWGETTLIEHVIDCYRAVECVPIIVVVGGTHEQAIRQQLSSLDDVLVVQNSNPSLGMLSSIQRGLKEAVQAGADHVVFGPVDVPFHGPRTIQTTLTGFHDSQTECVVASYEGRAGHPVVISQRVVHAFLAAELDSNPRETLAVFSPVHVPVNDPAVCENLNTPDDVHRWKRRAEPD